MNEHEGVKEQITYTCRLCNRQFEVPTEAEACFRTHVPFSELKVTNIAVEPGSDSYPYTPTNPFPTILKVENSRTGKSELYIQSRTIRSNAPIAHAKPGGAVELEK